MADTTTRAYTLKLKGGRLALWRNHVIFSRGVRAWGEWLLYMRGGLPASLADHKELLEIPACSATQAVKDRIAAIAPPAILQQDEFQVATNKVNRAKVATHKELLAARRSELSCILAPSWLCPETPLQITPKTWQPLATALPHNFADATFSGGE